MSHVDSDRVSLGTGGVPYPLHTVETAPEGSKHALETAVRRYGGVPNLTAVMGNSPALVNAYATVSQTFHEKSALDPVEQQVVLLTASVENECTYCVAAHSMMAHGAGIAPEVLSALRDGLVVPNARLAALQKFTSRLIATHGGVSDHEVREFLAAGFEPSQVLDVIVGVAYKTLSNYTNHLAGTPLDRPMESMRWEPPAKQAS